MQEYQMTDESAGHIDVRELAPLDEETNQIMKEEFRTGLGLSSFYYVFILSIPVINWFFPKLAFYKFWGGMSVTWFLTTIVAMILAYAIAHIHTGLYERRVKDYQKQGELKNIKEERANI
ncbi:hypothetical protein MKY34_14910 [Sporosarcina sp. FSL K6-1522]|uniref:hypothetical protein n=1 Tax=Sporosarcina sp. FSL K6-1522 TaxID=2921554 RepID=UPI00315A4328